MKLLDNPPLGALRTVLHRSTQSGSLEVHLSCYSMKSDHAGKSALAQIKALRAAQDQRRRTHSFSSLPDHAPCESPPRDYFDVPTPTAPGAPSGGGISTAAAGGGGEDELDVKKLHQLITVLNAEFLDYDFRCGFVVVVSPPPLFFLPGGRRHFVFFFSMRASLFSPQ